ncbi:hypothetical protein [Qipengyuania sp.]|uniref:hypothetical protein n=1 Tax=Qipengyuania sp. TaxID=2004515 RepID=UPI0035C7AE8C
MTPISGKKGRTRAFAALCALAAVGLAIPGAGGAAVGTLTRSAESFDIGFVPFTPANTDPALAREVAATLGADGLRFTPAAKAPRPERMVTMAVRVDRATARAITVRRTAKEATTSGKLGGALAAISQLDTTRYNLGSARGFQSFAAPAPKALAVPDSIREISMADLSSYGAEKDEKAGKPSRFQPRIAFEQQASAGRAPRTLEGAGDQSVDVGGSYRIMKNLDVTAGVRVSQDRDRIAPLTDGVDDDKAVYVGTQFRF